MKRSDLPPHLQAIVDATPPNAQATAHLAEPKAAKPRRKKAATKTPKVPQREAPVLAACLEYLKMKGIEHRRNNVGAAKYGKRLVRFGEPGSSDILGKLPGPPPRRDLAVECKAPGKRKNVTEAQRAFLDRVAADGGLAIVVDDVGQLVVAIEAAIKGDV